MMLLRIFFTLLMLFFTWSFSPNVMAQCNNTSSYGSATAPTSGSVNVSTCQYQTEYNTISSAVAGTTYESSLSAGGCITITSGSPTGPVVAFGTSPVQWTAGSSGTYYVHYNTDCVNCGTATGCMTSTLTYVSGGSGGGGGGGCGNGIVGGNCANALVVNTMPYSVTGLTTCGAGDCYSSTSACGSVYMNGEDYVLSFTPSATGPFEFVTNGTTTWTGIFVLDGCPDSGGTNCIGSSTLSGGLPNIQNLNLTGGQTYYIVVSTYPAPDCTPFDLIINEEVPPPGCGNNPVAADLCANAVPICDLTSYCGNTSAAYTASYSTQINTAFCGSIENSSYLSFVADASSVSFDVNVSNCTWNDGVQMMIFDGGCSGAVTNYGCVSPMAPGTSAFNATGLIPGNTYYMIIDGWAGDVCDYQIVTNNGVLVGANAGADVSICPGGSTTLTATGGDGTYTWSPGGATTSSITVSPGSTTTYTVSSNMGNPLCGGTTTADEVIVTVLAGTAPTIAGTSVLSGTVGPGTGQIVVICDGGSANLTATGGGTYSWSPTTGLSSGTSATPTATPTSTTTYTVTVDDGNGCIGTATITVQVDPAPVVTVNSGTICVGESINLTASGTATYAWSPTTGLSPTTGAAVTASPTTTTNYTVTGSTVGCPNATAVATVTVIPLPTANFNIGGDFCLATNDVDFNNQPGYGGSGTYSWTFPGATPATAANQNPSNVTWPSAGTYNVTYTVTVNGCTDDVTLPITINPTPTVTATATDALCFGQLGTINASTGSPGASYSWSSGQNTAGIHSVGAGTYTVTLTDGNGCIDTDVSTVAIPTQVVMTSSSTNALCFGVCNGTLTGNNATGGTPGYTYSWDGGPSSGSQSQTNVCAGTYIVTATDANGCPATSTETITVPTQLTVTAAAVDASCSGTCDGDVTSLGAGGTAPITYSWSVLGAGQNQLGTVCAGTYTVAATDANGCTATANATVAEPALLTVTASGTNASCFGVCDGTTSTVVAGGSTPYTYSWTGPTAIAGSAGSTLCAGTYSVTVTDAEGCTATDSYTVTEPTLLTVTVTGNDASCNGVCDGDATVTAAGGTTAYTYQWDAAGGLGTAASTTSTLCAGMAGVTVTDAQGCIATGSVAIAEPTPVTVSITSNDASCNGVCDGDATAVGAGGTVGYTYSWTIGGTAATTTSTLCVGTSTVTVTDAQGCTATGIATIAEPTLLTVTAAAVDASCSGVCDGDVTSLGAGGTAPITYSWSVLGAGQNQLGTVCAGTYTVTATDANGCIATANATVAEPALLTITASGTNTSCNGICDGTTSSVTGGGTTPYTYLWTGGAGTGSAGSGLCAATYTVTVTDALGCTATDSYIVTEPVLLTVTVTGNDASCNGVCDGDATATAAGGTTAYTYQWDAAGGLGTVASTTSILCAGTAGVTVTDAQGCIATGSVVIDEPTPVTATNSSTPAACGVSDGTAIVTAAGGAGGYGYVWAPVPVTGQGTASVTGLAGGAYTVTITDANGCVLVENVTVTNTAAPVASEVGGSHVDVLCFSNATGVAEVTQVGGTAPYTYVWSPAPGGGQGTATGTGLSAGVYSVTITDAGLCSDVVNITITEPTALTAAITSSTDPLCATVCDGTADVTVAGGTTTYTYSWTSGGTTASETAMCAGTETVTVTDANGCITTADLTLTAPALLTAAVVGTDPLCNGMCDGSADLTTTGGTGVLTYLWDDPATTTSEDVTGLCDGTFNVTVTDANGCTATDVVTVTEPTLIVLTPAFVASTCGQANGEVSVVAAGGTPGYTYLWDDAGASTTATTTGLVAGTYNVTVTDAQGCTETVASTITDGAAGTATAAIDNNASCFGACDGGATVTVVGGIGPFTYLWNTGETTFSATALCVGTNSVDVTDANGCVISVTADIIEPAVLTAAITSSTDPLCATVCDGAADVTVAGGTATYTYSWTSGGTTASETAMCAGTGTETVTVTDANGCITTADVTLTAPALLTAAVVGTDPLCNGVCDGSADLTTTGGTGVLTYLWDDPATTTSEDVTGLCDGTFNVTVTDANACTATDVVTVTEPTLIVLTTSGTDANCGQADGEVCVVAVGGTGVYTYAWNDAGAQTTACASNIVAGTYDVTVTDTQGCIQTASVTINDIAGPTATASVVIDASGFGLCDAEVTVAPVGGSGTYTYLWDDPSGQTTQNATGLCVGTYCVTVTDAVTGCITTACATVAEPGAIILTITTVDLQCNGVCIGEADATVTGGIAPYIYSWSSGATAEDLTGLCQGDYTLTVVDDNGVSTSQTVTINEPTAVAVTSVTGTDLNCNAVCDGTLGVTATGGTGTLTYLWDGGPTPALQNQALVCAGTYNVTATDDNGCTATDVYTVNEPPLLVLVTSQTDANCSQADGEACVSPTGGTAGYTYLWDDPAGQTTLCASNIFSGTYNVIVTDANGCIETAVVNVNDVSGGSASIAIDNNASCNTFCDGQATVAMTGGAAPYTYLWDSGAATNSTTNIGLCAGAINVSITDNVGCVTTATETITEPTPLVITSSSTDAICNGFADGTVSTMVTGGTAAVDYIYDWVDQATATNIGNTPTVTGLAIGTYCVTVTDDNGCFISECVTIAEPTPVVVTTTAIDANCGQSDGAIAVATSTGGSGFYTTEDWVDGLGNPVTNTNTVPAGAYTATVTDNVGCIGTALATVSDLSGPTTVLANQVDATCNGYCDGEISVAITGGVAPYTSIWSPLPAAGQGTPDVTGLCAGTYAVDVTDANGCTSSFQTTITEPAPVATSIVSTVDASGAGVCDGTADVIATGGTGAITYTWFNDCAATSLNGALTGPNVTGLCADDYAVVSTDVNGCADTLCLTIIEPGAIFTTLTGEDVTCFGVCDGQATVVASGGMPGFTYDWISVATGNPIGQTTTTATGLCAGDYFVVVTDANGIVHNSAIQTINEPTVLAGVATVISDYNGFDVSCEGACDGSAEVIPAGGTAPYTYAWDANSGNQTTPIATNLCAVTYDVVVTDANGCPQTFDVTLSKPPVLGNVFSFVDVSCNAACDGTITSAPAGGTPPFTYQWNDPALSTTATVDNLCVGTYDVTITDVNGCVLTESQSVTEPIALVLTGAMTGSNCNQNDGAAEVTIVTGVAPFTYLWDVNAASQTTAIASNLFAGCYDVTVTDANGCSEVVNICVVDLGAPSATILTQTDVSCNTGCDGFAQIQVFGGTPPLNYTWYDNNNNPIGQTTASALSLCAGTYVGEMIDDVGCQATISVIIAEPTALNAVISASTDVTCFGYSDGNATVIASGGTAPYTYAWNDAAAQTTAATTSTLFPGTYTVTVTDANGCTISVDAIIEEPLEIQLATTFTDAFCGTATGNTTVTTTNGVTPFTYAWDDAMSQSTATAIDLIPNTYTVTVVDADGCAQVATATVGDIPASDVIVASTTDALCFGDANGTATASISGTGTAPYLYEWFNASNISQGQNSITAIGLAAGDYYVTITDANGCVSSSGTGTVNQPILITAATFVDIDASCSGNCDGEASSTVVGGTFPYTYQWDDALAQTTITAFNLCTQTYNVTITDANGCSATAPVTISEPTGLTLDSTVVNAHCGLPDGNACIITSGGTGPYTYLWPDGSTNSCATNLLAGTYCVLVTDANGCSITTCAEIQDLNGPSAMIVDTSMVSCSGFNDGSATVDMIGGNGFFTALWGVNAGSQTTPTASNLTAGFYAVTITDSVGCNASISIEITEPDLMISIQTFYNTVCFGSCDGIASLATIGGTQPYSYNWLDVNNITVGTADSIGGLCAGAYTLSIVDALGCTDILNYSIGEPDQVTGSASSTGISCFGACDGTATAMGIVGMTPFSYQWGASAGNQTGATAFGLCPGNYICTITDADGCQTTVSAIVTQPTPLQAAISLTGNVSCNGYSDGWAEVSPSGGTAPFTYLWDNGAGSQVTASNLLAGTYTVTVTDANGCVTTATTTITEPTPLALTSNTINVDCFGNCNGSASVITSGGSGGNTYQWNDPTFATTAVVNNLCAGIYTCIITDVNGCSISETVNITQPTQIGMSVSITHPNCGLNNGLACVNIFGGSIPYVYQWNDVFTQTTACASNLVANCYTVTVIDGNGCFEDSVICLNDIEGPTVTFVTSSDVTCFGDQDGSMQYAVTGGTGVPTLEWLDGVGNTIPAGTNLNTLFGLDGGCYSLTATDVAGCISSESACIVEPNPLSSAILNSNANNVSCNTGCDGDALVNVSGGLITTDYGYSWNVGQTTQQATGLCAGTYSVTVSDDNNCTSLSSVTISEPTPIVISIDNLQHVSCTGLCDGQIQVSVSGGTAPYLYNWSPLGLTNPGVAGLCAGTYTVRITDANGCTEEMDITITEPPLLAESVSTVNTTCSDCNGEGSITASGGTTPYSYSWFGLGNSPGNSNNTGLCAGLVPFEVTDANGCVISSTADVIDEASPVIDSITFIEPLCNGYSTGNASVYTSGGTAPFAYQWDDPSLQTAQTALALQDGLYAVQVTDANGCIAFQLVNLTEPSQLFAVVDLERIICYGDSTQVWASGQGGTPFLNGTYTVTWDNLPNVGSAPITVAPLITTQYCATIVDANGCLPVSSCVTITVTPALALTITPPIDLCVGGAVDLVATATGGDTLTNPYTFIWYDDAGNSVPSTQSGNVSTANVNPSAPTTYYAVLTDGCSINDTVSTTVSINPNPQAFIAAFDSSGCAPFTAQFVANSGIGVNFEFDVDCDGIPEYSGPSNTFNYTYTTPGTYDVCLTVTASTGCDTTINSIAMITVHDLPIASFGVAPAETSILNPVIEMIDYSIGGSIYAWDFGDGTSIAGNGDSILVDSINTGIMSDPTHLYSDTGYFDITLAVFSINGTDTCESAYMQTIHIDGDYIFFAPSAFTPNGDGKNDIFIPKGFGIDVMTYEFYVFNRWGEQIFESHNKNIGWDGKHKGIPAQVDAYVWLVRTMDDKGESHEYIGHVTVVK